jgi:NarL family two-component system sensor histidine kinase YdfH
MDGQGIAHKPSHRGNVEEYVFFVIESLVITAVYVSVLWTDAVTLGAPRVAAITVLVGAHLAFLWLSPRILHNRRQLLIYLAVQAASIFVVGLLTPGHWLALALYMGLTGLAVGALWPDLRAIAAVIPISVVLSTAQLALSFGWRQILEYLPMVGLSLAFVVVYVVLFTRLAQARDRAQELLADLEVAHAQLQEYADQVQALTISQERQRMAQELHDTLAQGVAGLILQLEAADSHLENGHPDRAQETVQRAMALARTTLREARRAIQALRPAELERKGLIDALGREVDQFAEQTGIRAAFQISPAAIEGRPGATLDVPTAAAPEILRIVQESLANVARHGQAKQVRVQLDVREGRLCLTVQDDGVGFDPDRAAERPGSYGIRGMRERATHIGGELAVRSTPGQGTTVVLELEAEA